MNSSPNQRTHACIPVLLIVAMYVLGIVHVIGRDQPRISDWNTTVNWKQFEAPFCLMDRIGFRGLSCIQSVFIDDLPKEINLHKFKVIWRGVSARIFNSADGISVDLKYHSLVFWKAESRRHAFEPLSLIIGVYRRMRCVTENYNVPKLLMSLAGVCPTFPAVKV
jgi:hypothetical protein